MSKESEAGQLPNADAFKAASVPKTPEITRLARRAFSDLCAGARLAVEYLLADDKISTVDGQTKESIQVQLFPLTFPEGSTIEDDDLLDLLDRTTDLLCGLGEHYHNRDQFRHAEMLWRHYLAIQSQTAGIESQSVRWSAVMLRRALLAQDKRAEADQIVILFTQNASTRRM